MLREGSNTYTPKGVPSTNLVFDFIVLGSWFLGFISVYSVYSVVIGFYLVYFVYFVVKKE